MTKVFEQTVFLHISGTLYPDAQITPMLINEETYVTLIEQWQQKRFMILVQACMLNR